MNEKVASADTMEVERPRLGAFCSSCNEPADVQVSLGVHSRYSSSFRLCEGCKLALFGKLLALDL